MFKFNKKSWVTAILHLLILTVIILLVSYFFVTQKRIIGPLLILLGIISLLPIYFFKVPFQVLKADIMFGIIDNGILAIFAIFGAELFGILGAIVGGLVGNAITDGLAGLFEGYEWQKTKKLKIKDKRTILTVAIGKLSGCLLGGGIVLTMAWSILNVA
ncbi:hypothetical protein J4437_02595 [Candidatus Woesearchaeota archaeon]|nr:hypothetical protein [Candidatus Woesearchaeota archaeon]